MTEVTCAFPVQSVVMEGLMHVYPAICSFMADVSFRLSVSSCYRSVSRSNYIRFALSCLKPLELKSWQIFLAQGLGAGIGAGIVFVPSVAIVSHYFLKRRALAMSIVASGSSLGAVVHPIMLNNTLRSHLGFANAVRASAGLVSALLLVACLLMRPRLPPPKSKSQFWKSFRRFIHDRAFIFATLGHVSSLLIVSDVIDKFSRMATYTIGFYFPLFFLQLDAISHGISQKFAFYSVR